MAIRLYWWHEKRASGDENYGDLLSQFLVEKISKQKVIAIKHPAKGLHKYFFKHYVTIGSIISSATKNSIVWGSGIIKKNENIRDAKFIAVRGPQTRKRILDLGFSCPEVYGDPAILLPDYYSNSKIQKEYEIGIIPHYVDFKTVNEVLKNDKRIKVIDLLTKDAHSVTDQILQCKTIISSSLHGIIIPQSYRIPALWIKFSNKLSGDNIKFYDYFESMNIDFKNEYFIEPKNLSFDLLKQKLEKNESVLLQNKEILEFRKKYLLKSCPFLT
jgi:hypothetical protein